MKRERLATRDGYGNARAVKSPKSSYVVAIEEEVREIMREILYELCYLEDLIDEGKLVFVEGEDER